MTPKIHKMFAGFRLMTPLQKHRRRTKPLIKFKNTCKKSGKKPSKTLKNHQNLTKTLKTIQWHVSIKFNREPERIKLQGKSKLDFGFKPKTSLILVGCLNNCTIGSVSYDSYPHPILCNILYTFSN
jgi:hypothetical protein